MSILLFDSLDTDRRDRSS